MTRDVPRRQYYARKAKTDAQNRVFDVVVEAKRRRLDSKRRVFVGANEGSNTPKISLQLDGGRISNLPQDVVHCILEHLSVRDAARTSVLSKQWRCIWRMKNNLVLDKLFFIQLNSNKDKDAHQSVFTRAIEMIISVHTGPILSFNLYIPPKLDQCRVSRWLEHFLDKRVRVLEILFSEKKASEIPLLACEGLVELKLTTWILTPLLKLGTFTNLIRVELVDISFTADISFGSQVKALSLHRCTGIQHLGCQFTNANSLTNLILGESEQIDWRWFEFTKQLEFLGLALTRANPNKRMPVNLIKLLSNTPIISALNLTGYTLEVLGTLYSISMSMGLATKIENLKLIGLGFRNSCQISNSLGLIRCLPNLRILQILLEPGEIFLKLTAEQILEPDRWKGVLLDQLRTVSIQGVVFEDNVLQFIKVLLASSPSLRVIYFYCNIKADAYAEMWNINERLKQFPKKSLSTKLYLSFMEPGRLRLA